MAGRQEPHDVGENWHPGNNPYNPHEPTEDAGGPGFLELPIYIVRDNAVRFRIRGNGPLTIIIYLNGQEMKTIHHKYWQNNLYNVNVSGFGQYRVELTDSQERKAIKNATFA